MLIFDNIFNKFKLNKKKKIGNVAEGVDPDDVATVSQLGPTTPTDWVLYEIQQTDITEVGGTYTLNTGYIYYNIKDNLCHAQIYLDGTAASTITSIELQLPAEIDLTTDESGIYIPCTALSGGGTYQPAQALLSPGAPNTIFINRITGTFTDGALNIALTTTLALNI